MHSQINNDKLPKGFEVLTYQNTRDSLMKYREKGATRGKFLGFPQLHEHYTMALPGVTDWTGYPQSGKTEFLIECLLNTSIYYGWKHLLYVPDVGDKNEILSNIIHKITGKTFDKRFINSNYISESEVDKELQWVYEHFIIIYEVDESASMTPYQFWDYAAELSKSIGLNTATIDSWKDLKLNVDQDGTTINRDDKYLENVLKYRNKIADKYNLHLHTIVHPTNIPADKDGKRPEPKPFHLSGGAQWFNSGRTMITVHRIDGTSNEVDIIINKAKPKSVAKLGRVRKEFDVTKSVFYYMNESMIKTYAVKDYVEPLASQIEKGELSNDENDIPF